MASGENILAIPTDVGRKNFSESIVYGRTLKMAQFAVGSGGHDPVDNTLALTPDPSLTSLPNLVYQGNIDFAIITNIYDIQFTINLAKDVAIGPISNFGIYGQIIASQNPDDSGLIGTTFLYAIANFPYRYKVREEYTFTVTLNF